MRKWRAELGKKSSDWEKNICDLTDRMMQTPEEYFELLETLIEDVEDLVIEAYLRGKQNAKTNQETSKESA